MITYNLMMTMVLIGFQKDFLPFFWRCLFYFFFHVGKSKANERRNVERTRLLIRFIDETGKIRNSTLLKGSVVNLFFWEFFAFQSVIFFQNDSYHLEMKEAKFPTFVIPWKVFSTANTIRRPIFAIHTFRHFGLHVSPLLLQGL